MTNVNGLYNNSAVIGSYYISLYFNNRIVGGFMYTKNSIQVPEVSKILLNF